MSEVQEILILMVQKNFAKYGYQSIEIDAEAFSQYYLEKYEGILMRKKDDWIQLLIDVYIDKYKNRF